MTAAYTETLLKGGSLNQTVLRSYADGRRVVRKSISRRQEREYGFVRWYSQFKRLQRYNVIFPQLFPQLTDAGADGEVAFFEMEYIEGSIDVKQYLCGEVSSAEIEALNAGIWQALDRMHGERGFASFAGSLGLYFEEEVGQRLADAQTNAEFREFCAHADVEVDGARYPGLMRNLAWLGEAFRCASPSAECYTHGNVTLENILVVPSSGRIVFVDPYEENVVDCREAEYSQILQCSNQHYGYINDRAVEVDGPRVQFHGAIPSALRAFNECFQAEMRRRLNADQITLVRLLELSQFTRMLPFKVAAGQIGKAKYFYGVASRLAEAARFERFDARLAG